MTTGDESNGIRTDHKATTEEWAVVGVVGVVGAVRTCSFISLGREGWWPRSCSMFFMGYSHFVMYLLDTTVGDGASIFGDFCFELIISPTSIEVNTVNLQSEVVRCQHVRSTCCFHARRKQHQKLIQRPVVTKP